MYRSLAGKSVGSTSFNNSWKALASNDPTGFDKVQHDFIQQSHYDPVVSKVKSGIGLNLNTRSAALQNVVWSMGVQHGSGGAYKLFRNAGIRPSMSDQEIINRLYNERMKVDKYFSRSSSSIKASVKRRFQSELKDALAMLGTTSNTKMGRLST
jgi:hypothetical protein